LYRRASLEDGDNRAHEIVGEMVIAPRTSLPRLGAELVKESAMSDQQDSLPQQGWAHTAHPCTDQNRQQKMENPD